jgi:hypothetical protein
MGPGRWLDGPVTDKPHEIEAHQIDYDQWTVYCKDCPPGRRTVSGVTWEEVYRRVLECAPDPELYITESGLQGYRRRQG